ncbi:MAG: carbohydrate kinase [Bacteroidales bacterium]|nr:carbohydrate kinase [Bacteroidales bacterium]
MRKIYAIGETVFDIIFANGVPSGGHPGGSVLNSTVSLGRLGLEPVFMSDCCNDMIGTEIAKFLKANGVTPHQLVDGSAMQTSIALAFLDDKGDAKYQFYKQKPQSPDLAKFAVDFQKDDILLFGSYYAIMPEIREGVKKLVYMAHQQGAIVVYDPNFRRPHLKDLPKVKPYIEENISLADIVKGSNEDFALIFGCENQSIAFDIIHNINRSATIFYTKGKDGCACYQRGITLEYGAPAIKPVSTIGAGDNFNAGIVYGVVRNNITRNDIHSTIKKEVIDNIVEYATSFAQEVCMSQENYIRRNDSLYINLNGIPPTRARIPF